MLTFWREEMKAELAQLERGGTGVAEPEEVAKRGAKGGIRV